ncbi:hypothetical protein ACFSSC_02800 [Corynebacterium mendelii]|uniref:Uncharacterized protein n=1 Tax=Corynebacterium mendelii TaxID=2765362 RepID=A0A939E1Z2_9CORY|nr:hypothetical protein [Corynebacterium mendelii]MBN9644206.1 hypothetical protein [Corynebacterium mendelii]
MNAPAGDGLCTDHADDTAPGSHSDFLERTDTGSFPALAAAPAPFMALVDRAGTHPAETPGNQGHPELADVVRGRTDTPADDNGRFDPLTDPFPALDTDDLPDTPLYESARISSRRLHPDGPAHQNPSPRNVSPVVGITAPGTTPVSSATHPYGRHCCGGSATESAAQAAPCQGRHRL